MSATLGKGRLVATLFTLLSMKLRSLQALLSLALAGTLPLSAEVIISEFMASNSTTLADEDGQFADWIEIENTGPDPVNLENWYLTDQSDFSASDPDSFWTFPSRALASGQRIVVFASAKDRKPSPTGELHTNFQLAASGEYLALIAPDGVTKTTEFAPAYPNQESDISYGYGQASLNALNLVPEGTATKVLIPSNGTDGLDWTGGNEPFNDASWLSRETGVGFETGGTPGGMTLLDQFDSLNLGDIDGQGGWSSPVAGANVALDPDDAENQVLSQSGSNVRSWKSMPISNNTTATIFFRMRRDGSVNTSIGGTDIASPGTAYSDFEVQLNNQNNDILNARDGSAFDPVDTIADGVWYNVWLVANLSSDTYEAYLQGGSLTEQTKLDNGAQTIFNFRNGSSGNAMAHFLTRTGNPSTGNFLIDDIYYGDGINLGNPAGNPGLTDLISDNGNIESEMSGNSASAYLRIPFTTTAGAGDFSSLSLRMRYDDGFVAYLNGTEIASRNDPALLNWQASATTEHPMQDVITFENIDITAFQNLLLPAGQENILAIHGLNLNSGDGDFLITPILEGVTLDQEPQGIFFTSPTPNTDNGEGILGFVGDTEFSVDRGFYDAPFHLEIASDTAGATIVYTLDGSTPSLGNGTQGTSPVVINISETTPVRAAAFKTGYLPTNVDTQTYLFLDDIIAQDNSPAGYPTTLKGDGGNGSFPADYEMDTEITQNGSYSDLIDDALLAVPTISIVTDKENLFDPGTGIYQNPQQRGSNWERPTSVEFIRPDGSVENIQVNAGLRIQGGHTRLPSKNPKHSFRLSFKDEFGPKSLDYDLFPDDDGATTKFDQLVLRGAGNQSWLHHNTFKGDNRGRAQYIRDQWAKDMQLAMSGIGTRSIYAHLYINGIYWGLYNPTERASAGFGESYLGGDKNDYNALNSGDAIDGANASSDYQQLISLANSGMSDPTKYAEMEALLDIDAFTDYMLIQQYGGNLDWDHHNWYAIRNHVSGKWYFICWDSEFIFISPSDNVLSLNNGQDPTGIWRNLLENDEYRLFFADKVNQHLTNGGFLTPGPVVDYWEIRKNQMFDAIVAESARWGDYRRDVAPVGGPAPIPLYDRDEEWAAQRDYLFNNYFPVRTDNVLQQYRNAGYLPALEAPVFSLASGLVAPGTSLTITSPDGGQIFYTTDGTDPRVPAVVGELALLSEGDAMRVQVALNDDLGTTWHGGNEPFDDSTWHSGTAAGYENNPGDYAGLFDINLISEMRTKSPSCYVRMEFNIPDQATLDSISGLTLHVRYDDGFAAFINGDFVVSENVPDPLTWDGTDGTNHTDSLAAVYQPFGLPASAVSELQVGTNILAIHAYNASAGSSDFLIDATLTAVTGATESLSPSGQLYTNPLTINGPTIVSARVRNGGDWSALTSLEYFTAVPATAGNLVISEIMYHPGGAAGEEFLELQNISGAPIDLTGVYFSEGIEFTFPFGVNLAAGERTLIVRNLAEFEAIHGAALPVAGVFENGTALNNSGERLTLKARDGSLIQSFSFNDAHPWPVLTDGNGHSLVLRQPGTNPNPSNAENWRASSTADGNPGSANSSPFVGNPTDDLDGDGFTALMEYALGTSDTNPFDYSESLEIQSANGQISLLRTESATADEALLNLEESYNLDDWQPFQNAEGGETQTLLPDGKIRTSFPLNGVSGPKYFRFKVDLR